MNLHDPDMNITMPWPCAEFTKEQLFGGTDVKIEDLKAQKIEMDAVYTEGVCDDGAAILRDGERMTISEILAELNEYAWIKHCAQLALRKGRRA